MVHLLKVPDAVQEPVLETEGEIMGFAKFISASRSSIAGVTGISKSNYIVVTINNTGQSGEDSEEIILSPVEAATFAKNILVLIEGEK